MRKVYRRLGAQALGAALLVSALPSAFAVVLNPGATVALNGTTAALEPDLAGTVIEDMIRSWTISTPQGDIAGRVLRIGFDSVLLDLSGGTRATLLPESIRRLVLCDD